MGESSMIALAHQNRLPKTVFKGSVSWTLPFDRGRAKSRDISLSISGHQTQGDMSPTSTVGAGRDIESSAWDAIGEKMGPHETTIAERKRKREQASKRREKLVKQKLRKRDVEEYEKESKEWMTASLNDLNDRDD